MKVKSESEVAQSCPTLSDPMDCSPPGSSVHGIFQARVLEWGAIAFSFIVYNRNLFFILLPMLDIIDVLNLYNLQVKICLYGFHVHFFINNVEQSAFFCHHNNPNANIFTHFLGLFSCFLFVGVLGFFFAALATMQDLKFLDQELNWRPLQRK